MQGSKNKYCIICKLNTEKILYKLKCIYGKTLALASFLIFVPMDKMFLNIMKHNKITN